jgi:hypothetical protein
LAAERKIENLSGAIPRSLASHVGRKCKAPQGQSFGKSMALYAKWHDMETGGGVIYAIREGVKEQHRHTALSISRAFGNSDVQDLAKEMPDRTKEFVPDLCHFVEEFCAEMLAESSAISTDEAWTLTT